MKNSGNGAKGEWLNDELMKILAFSVLYSKRHWISETATFLGGIRAINELIHSL